MSSPPHRYVRNMRRLAVALLALSLSAGCASDPEPRTDSDLVSSFPASKDNRAVRLYEAYKKAGPVTTYVNVTKPRKLMSIRIDCIGGKGQVEVFVGDMGTTADCPANGKRGATGRLGAHDLDDKTQIEVTPTGTNIVWSVAVDLYDSVNHDG